MEHLTTSNGGVQLAISVAGSGPNLLFVHGLGSAQVLWQPMIATLSDRFTCWNLDLRGHGSSDRASGSYNMAAYASDVSAALDHIGAPAIGVGHSLGGMALTHVAVDDHGALAALYVLDSPLFRPPGEQSSSRAIFERQLAMVRSFQAEGKPVDAYEEVLAGAPNPVGGTNRETMVPAQLRGRAESLSQMDPECMAQVIDGRLVEPLPAAVAVPMRMVAADPNMGAAFKSDYSDRLLELTPHAEIETIHGVGHQLMMMKNVDKQIEQDLVAWLDHIL